MLTHPTGLFSGDYILGCWSLIFLHTLQPPKMYFKSDVGRRAASCWALPHISSLFYFVFFCYNFHDFCYNFERTQNRPLKRLMFIRLALGIPSGTCTCHIRRSTYYISI